MTETPMSIVTGAAGGIGQACARRFAAAGDTVVLADMANTVHEFADALEREGAQTVAVEVDVTDPDAMARLAEMAGAAGRLRAVAHTAGLSPTMADWDRVLAVNLVGTVLLLDAIEPLVVEGTAIVCIASQAGHFLVPDAATSEVLGDPLAADFLTRAHDVGIDDSGIAYSFSKWAVRRLAIERAAAWGPRLARVVSLSPGIIDTPMGRQEMEQQEAMATIVDMTPLQRVGQPDEIAAVVEFLCSDAASFVTGTDLLVDGGSTEVMKGVLAG